MTEGGRGVIRDDQITFVGSGLNRPECVVAHCSGHLFVPDWTGAGGVSVVAPDGTVRRILARDRREPLRPNGIALLDGGAFLLAHLGDEDGGVFRLDPDGTTTPILTEIGGRPLPPTNFVMVDARGRIWVTVSTRLQPRARGYRADVADGFIVLIEDGNARIVADGLGYTNECCVDPSGTRLFANETFGRRLSAFDIEHDGSLVNQRTVATFGAGVFPDGLAFDREGGIWITSVVSNRLLRVDAEGKIEVVVDGGDAAHVDGVEAAYQAGTMDANHLRTAGSSNFNNISNIAFGGPDLKMGYLGCLLGHRIMQIELPVAGHPLPHWDADLGPLAE